MNTSTSQFFALIGRHVSRCAFNFTRTFVAVSLLAVTPVGAQEPTPDRGTLSPARGAIACKPTTNLELGDGCRHGDIIRTWLELADSSRHAIAVEVIDGQAYFEGDILLDLDPDGIARLGAGFPGKSTGRATASNLWPDNTVSYTVDANLPNPSRVHNAIDDWEADTNVRFQLRTTESDYVTFRPKEGGCSSHVGRIGGQQFINLADGCSTGSTRHEIGHAVGLFHEQSRSDRDETIEIHWENIQQGKEHNFETWVDRGYAGFDLGPHDIGSIMHYGSNAFSDNGEPTITLKNGEIYSTQRSALSNGDIAGIDYLYPPLGNRFGAAIAACDFDGDGLDDVAVGAKLEDVGNVPSAGAVRVFYAANLPADPASGNRYHQGNSALEGAPGISDRFGTALASDDFNGDGYCDLAIGVPGESLDGAAEAGTVHVLYGAPGGLNSGVTDQVWHQGVEGVKSEPEIGDRFGTALASGDFNGDGYGDLAIGVPGESLAGQEDAGMVSVLYGGQAGLQSDAPQDQTWHQNTNGIKGDPEVGDEFGTAVISGDFNHDGYTDLAVGAPGESVAGQERAGAVHVLYGSFTGLQDGEPQDQRWNQNTHGVKGGPAEAGDRFGLSLAAGDFDNDGSDDLAIGVPGKTVSGQTSAGMVNVLYGSSSGLSASGDDAWNQDTEGVNGTAEVDDAFGKALIAGDFDGDGKADLAVGAPGESVAGAAEAGAVHVLYGASGGLQAAGNQNWTQKSSAIATAPDSGELFGRALAAGDVDGDGISDLLVGVPREIIDGADAGMVHLFYGSVAGVQVSSPVEQVLTAD